MGLFFSKTLTFLIDTGKAALVSRQLNRTLYIRRPVSLLCTLSFIIYVNSTLALAQGTGKKEVSSIAIINFDTTRSLGRNNLKEFFDAESCVGSAEGSIYINDAAFADLELVLDTSCGNIFTTLSLRTLCTGPNLGRPQLNIETIADGPDHCDWLKSPRYEDEIASSEKCDNLGRSLKELLCESNKGEMREYYELQLQQVGQLFNQAEIEQALKNEKEKSNSCNFPIIECGSPSCRFEPNTNNNIDRLIDIKCSGICKTKGGDLSLDLKYGTYVCRAADDSNLVKGSGENVLSLYGSSYNIQVYNSWTNRPVSEAICPLIDIPGLKEAETNFLSQATKQAIPLLGVEESVSGETWNYPRSIPDSIGWCTKENKESEDSGENESPAGETSSQPIDSNDLPSSSINKTDLNTQGTVDGANTYSGAFVPGGYGWIAEFIPGLESVPISVFGANACNKIGLPTYEYGSPRLKENRDTQTVGIESFSPLTGDTHTSLLNGIIYQRIENLSKAEMQFTDAEKADLWKRLKKQMINNKSAWSVACDGRESSRSCSFALDGHPLSITLRQRKSDTDVEQNAFSFSCRTNIFESDLLNLNSTVNPFLASNRNPSPVCNLVEKAKKPETRNIHDAEVGSDCGNMKQLNPQAFGSDQVSNQAKNDKYEKELDNKERPESSNRETNGTKGL